MAKLHRVTINDRTFLARSGQVLLDAALLAGVDLPHDCRAGRCGSCVCHVKSGITLVGNNAEAGMVHACQARVFSDLELAVEPVPAPTLVEGRVAQIGAIGPDIVEVTMRLAHAIPFLPGQYCRFQFRGFPERCFSPTASMKTMRTAPNVLRLHVRKLAQGRVTSHLGTRIGVGHRVSVTGPFGHAYLRPGNTRRLVLVGSGTGFAPIWSVAAAALTENPMRSVTLVVPAKSAAHIYMQPALAALAHFKNAHVRLHDASAAGRPDLGSLLPVLTADDLVYAAGAPHTVAAVGALAKAAGAAFYQDPFETSNDNRQTGSRQPRWLDAARNWLAI